jgi:hypothetical protein
MTFSKAVFFLLVVALCEGGCGKREKKPATAGAGRTCPCGVDGGGVKTIRGGDGGLGLGLGLTPPRPGPARRVQYFSLLAAAKGYRNHGRCVASVHAILPPELTREADTANLAERVCQTRRALAEKRPALCEEIDDPFWPQACRRLYAALHGKPDECPPRRDRAGGRDELCVAMATRDPALCRAVRSAGGRQRCAAILGSASLCRGMRTTAEVASCQLDRKRWRAVLRPAKATLPQKYAPKYELALTEGGKTVRGNSAALNQGVVVGRRSSGRWVLGDLRASTRRSGVERQLQLMVDLPSPGKMPASLKAGTREQSARFCALFKGRPVPSGQIRGTFQLTEFAANRGARVVGSYAVKIVLKEVTLDVRGVFDTFVRDVVPGAWVRSTCADRLAEAPRARPSDTSVHDVQETGARPCFFVAHWQGLRQVGYRVYGVRARAACHGLGLRNGDVVFAVGSRAMTRWADVVSLYGLLAGKNPLVVRLLRKGKKITLKRAGR